MCGIIVYDSHDSIKIGAASQAASATITMSASPHRTFKMSLTYSIFRLRGNNYKRDHQSIEYPVVL